MLDKESKSFDAVSVSTPDHTHAIAAMAAMQRKKHVYVQKPLTWSVSEARQLAKRAAETKVATQMGNQGHSSDDARTAVEYIQFGDCQRGQPIHAGGITQQNPVKPPTTSGAAGRCAVFAANFAKHFACRIQ